VAERGLGPHGPYIGRDLLGAAFCYDPWELYRRGVLTNPNMVVIGQIGRGKSGFVKTYLWRQQAFGRQAWVVDPKGEYGPLAQACGSVPLRIAPGGAVRLNPLDTGAGGPTGEPSLVRRHAGLLGSLAEASLGRSLSPRERTAAELAIRTAHAQPGLLTIPAVAAALLEPSAQVAAEVRTTVRELADDGRDIALELRRLIAGDLAGMFDGPTSPGISLAGPMVVLDLSAVYASAALGILMTCATAWLQAALVSADPAARRIVVVDEAWAILSNLAMARWLQASFKLSRAYGVANIAVLHRLSDLRAAGADGSEQQRLAEGLLSDSETRVIYGQPASEVAGATDLLGLTGTEAELLPQLPRGVALWKLGLRSFLVAHRVSRLEAALIDTDRRMVVAAEER
jgi:type IV secretory pathway VirB4 component